MNGLRLQRQHGLGHGRRIVLARVALIAQALGNIEQHDLTELHHGFGGPIVAAHEQLARALAYAFSAGLVGITKRFSHLRL